VEKHTISCEVIMFTSEITVYTDSDDDNETVEGIREMYNRNDCPASTDVSFDDQFTINQRKAIRHQSLMKQMCDLVEK